MKKIVGAGEKNIVVVVVAFVVIVVIVFAVGLMKREGFSSLTKML